MRHGITWACRSKKSGTTCSLKWHTVTAVASLTMNYIIDLNKAITYTLILKSLHYEFGNIFDVFFYHFKAGVGVTYVSENFDSRLSLKLLRRKTELLN